MTWRALIKTAARSARCSLAPAASTAACGALRAAPAALSALSPALQARGFAKAAKKAKGGAKAAPAPAGDAGEADGADGEAVLEKARKNMAGGVLHFTRALAQMRPGRADAGIFDELRVPAYGQHVPLAQVAQVAVSGTHSLSVSVYDPSLMQDIKKAVEAMNPVFSIREDVNSLEISFPKMSKETRTELQKAVKKQAEQARQHVRRVRQDAMAQAKKLKDDISEDDVKKLEKQIQKVTDDAVDEISKLLTAKEKDLEAV